MQRPAGTLPGQTTAAADQDRQAEPVRPAPRFSLASGSRPLDGYTIKRGIGVGGFGEVYYAVSDAGKEVALKRIQRNLDIEIRGVKQCLNLKHPNLLALYDIRYDADGGAWVVMEFMSGESLKDAIDRHPDGMPLDQVRHWLVGIASGVQYLHDHGIVHRDLKPGNIFLDQGIVKIGDYGLSKFISCSRRSGHTESVGTFHYMAPEIGQGRYGKEIDIYALGILFYEMLTGRVPFDGESSQEIIMKHLTAAPSLGGIPAPMEHVIARALAKRPEQRFPSVSAMLAALGWGPADDSSEANAAWLEAPLDAPLPVLVQPAAPVVVPAETSPVYAAYPLPASRIEPAEGQPGARPQERHDEWWMEAARWLLLMALVILVMTRANWLVPLAVTVGTIYGFYLLFSTLLDLTFGSDADSAPASQSITPAQQRREVHRRERQLARHQLRDVDDLVGGVLRAKSWRRRWSELSGSVVMSTLVAAVLAIIMTVLGSQEASTEWVDWLPMYAWLAVTSAVGAWGVLLPSKIWEGREADPAMRRFVQLVVGMGLGAFVHLLAGYLRLLRTDVLHLQPLTTGRLPEVLFDSGGDPRILADMLYFGLVLALLPWWRQADPLRGARLALAATLLVILVSVLVWLVLPIPRGFMITTTMAVAVQLSAPWISPRRRRELAQDAVASSDRGSSDPS